MKQFLNMKQYLFAWKSMGLAIITASVFVAETGFSQIITTTDYSATSYTAFPASTSDLLENGSIYRSGDPTISGPAIDYGGASQVALMTDGGLTSFACWLDNATTTPSNPDIITYQLNLAQSAVGYDINGINSIAGYNNGGEYSDQLFDVYVSYVSDPSTFVLLDSVNYSPFSSDQSGPTSSEVSLTDDSGDLATGVAAIQFQFFKGGDNGQIINEEDVFGAPTAAPEPSALALFGGGLVCLLALGRRNRQTI